MLLNSSKDFGKAGNNLRGIMMKSEIQDLIVGRPTSTSRYPSSPNVSKNVRCSSHSEAQLN
jgi:hypothetical protein